MALTHLLVGAALALVFFSGSEAGEVGVCYGMNGNNLLDPVDVVHLLNQNSITRVRLYDANHMALSALANTGIKVSVSLPNENINDAATSVSYALQWVQNNVKTFSDTLIDSVAVGNEVFRQAHELTPRLLPAMKNIQAALASVGMADSVKVSTPISLDALKESSPPSAGEFQDDIAQSVMSPMIHFLEQTGSYLMFNFYPYFAYMDAPDKINLDYVLFRPNNGFFDPGTGLTYYNLYDAMLDAVYHAVEKLENTGQYTLETMLRGGRHGKPPKVITRGVESGFPSSGGGHIGAPMKLDSRNNSLDSGRCLSCRETVNAASKENAQTYNSNLISKVLSGTGTPYYPDADISVYIFSLFNENEKPGDEDERNFGLFYPNGAPVYKVDFVHPGPGPAPATPSWCTANAAVGDKRLQDALDYACGHGADCSAIQPGKPCYQPNSVVAHASYAFDDYYQRKGRASGTCDFAGAASVVYQKPAGTCDVNPASWCVANTAVGDKRLQDALDYACGHGADCSAIQPGKPCYQPNSVVAHASYAFNDYYQRKGRASGTCDFAGAASVVYQKPTGTCGANPASWCVANTAVGDKRLQDALDYACGHGADCSAIQTGGQCFDPNTKAAHASYAFNDYYQRNGRSDQSCDFGGCGSVVHQQPKIGNCVLPARA